MKKIIQFIVLLLTWPFVLGVLIILCMAWLVLHCWGCENENLMATDELKSVAYCLWHFKVKPKD